MSLRREDLTIAEDFSNLNHVILSIRPEWTWQDVQMKRFTTGITNKIVGFYLKQDGDWDDMLLVRRYGESTELLIDRKAELRNMNFMYENGLAKPAYCSLNNGLVYGFAPGVTTDPITCKHEHVYPLVAKTMALMHSLDISDRTEFKSEPFLFPKLLSIVENLPETFTKPEHGELINKTDYTRESLLTEVKTLRRIVEKHAAPIFSFAHNDLLLQNVVYNKKEDRVYFIDFEYGEFNYSLYDIADHFAEMVGVDSVDFSLFPDREFEIKWLTAYFTAKGMSGEEITPPFLDSVCNQVNMFAACSHLFWGVWALFQAEHSLIDFDFMPYGIMKIDEYFNRKDEFLYFTTNNEVNL